MYLQGNTDKTWNGLTSNNFHWSFIPVFLSDDILWFISMWLLLLLLLVIYLTLTEVNIFTMKNIYIPVAIPLSDKDGTLINFYKKMEKRLRGAMDFQNDSKQFLLL